MYAKNIFHSKLIYQMRCLNIPFFFQQDTENLESKCTSVIPTEVIFKKDGSEYTFSNKGIYIKIIDQ